MMRVLKSALTEYGIAWTVNRGLYSAKLKMMKKYSATEHFFEKKVNIKRIDIFNFNFDLISDFLLRLSTEDQRGIIKVADKAIDGIITGFSSIDLDYGRPINWHLNPLTGFENDKETKWYKIKDFDKKVGDIKVIWEASRLTHFLYFARAYLITEDKKYYKAFSEQLNDWIENNPYSYGSNYKCGQEATLRMLNVLISYTVFHNYNLTTDCDRKKVEELVEGGYKKVLSNFFYAHKCIKNNHTFTEILGLIVGAWCSENDNALQKSYKLMDKGIRNQFMPDGGFTQYSFNYHRFTLQILECLYKISEKTGMYIKESERIKNSVLLLYQVQEENGDVPNYGSNDGALIFPLSTCGYRDFRPVLNTMYTLMKGNRLYPPGNYDEELLWFGKTNKLPLKNIKKKSSAFEESGVYVLRHDEGFLMTCLQNYKSRPAHMDQLHIDLWHKGVNIFCDTGTFSYASQLGKELSSTSGHNTIKIPGVEQMNKQGAFLVTNWTRRGIAEWSNKSFIGKMYSQNGYNHQRKILVKAESYIIEDKVFTDSDTCDFTFHTPCEVHLIEDGFKLLNNNKQIALVKSDGEVVITEAFRSLYYLKKEKISKVIIKKKVYKNRCASEIRIILQ